MAGLLTFRVFDPERPVNVGGIDPERLFRFLSIPSGILYGGDAACRVINNGIKNKQFLLYAARRVPTVWLKRVNI